MFTLGHDPRRNHMWFNTFQQRLREAQNESEIDTEIQLLLHAMDNNRRRLDPGGEVRYLDNRSVTMNQHSEGSISRPSLTFSDNYFT